MLLVEATKRMEPRAAAGILTLALEKKTGQDVLRTLAFGLATVAGRMEPAEAAQVSGHALRILERALEKDAEARSFLHQALADLAERMEPRAAARFLMQDIEKGNDRRWRAAQLATVVGRMEPAEAARLSGQAARILTPALEKETSATERVGLAEGLMSLARKIEPHDLARVLTQEIERESDAWVRKPLAKLLATVAWRMEAQEAARVSGQVANILIRALDKEPNAFRRANLAEGLAAVAGRMEPGEAARVSRQAATVLLRAIQKETDANYLSAQSGGLVAVVGWIEPAEAAQMSGQAASILEKETERSRNHWLDHGLVALSGRMQPAEAVRTLTRVLQKRMDVIERIWLAKGLAIVAGRMNRTEAVAVCYPVMQTLIQAAQTEKDESARLVFSKAAATLLSASDHTDSGPIAAQLASAICSSQKLNAPKGGDYYKYDFALGDDVLDTLLTDNSRSQVSRRTVAVAAALGLGSATPCSALPALAVVSEPLPCRLSTQVLVELLKMPTCFGEARKVVLKHLGNRYGRVFANHWEFVRFAQEQHLDLDLTSPPKRPRRP